MEPSTYIQAGPAAGQSSFFYYTPDTKADARQHGHFSQQPSAGQVVMYNPYAQSLPATPIYSRPSSSGSQAPLPSQVYQQPRFQSDLTLMVSPRPLYHRPTVLIDQPPRLTIESNGCEADLFCYPATPPLSASGSSISSPASAGVSPIHGLPAYYAFEGVKEGCAGEVQSENLAGNEWAGCGSPTMTPVFVQPTSLMSQGASELLSTASCPSLSPSPSPFQQSQATSDDSFCDPRDLTVATAGPSLSSLQPSSKILPDLPALPILHSSEEDEHRFMFGGEAIVKPLPTHSTFDFPLGEITQPLPIFDHFSDLDSEDEFVNGLVNFPPSENVHFVGSKRQRTGLDLTASHGEPLVAEEEFEEFDNFAVACLPSPPASVPEAEGKREKRGKRSRKARSPEDGSRSRKHAMSSEEAAADAESQASTHEHAAQDHVGSDSHVHAAGETPSEADGSSSQAPVNRRGRKQSLTEDPSKTFVCDQCNRRFRRQEHLKRHYRSLHTHDKPFECHECGKKFSRSDNLSQHARTHGSGAIVMGVLEDGELPADGEGEHIRSLGNVLFHVAAAASGSETDSASAHSSGDDSQGRKKRKRSE